jgi:hypothetical protein
LFSCLFVFAGAPRAIRKETIKAVGCFVNVRSDGEHADGYSVRLWIRGSGLIGLVDYHRGLAGDPPMGVLADVRYDSSTGELSFEAKLTSGLHYCTKHKGVPSHDLLSFSGFLNPDKLEGKIVIEDRLDSSSVLIDVRENFLMRKDNDCAMENYENDDAWWQYWKPVNQFRGAKW